LNINLIKFKSLNSTNNSKNPVSLEKRIVSLDFLRGVALLGISLINIEVFSMISAARINPTAYGDLTGINKAVFIFSHIIADGKFIAIFSMLFGAGIVLFTNKLEKNGLKSSGIHYQRMFWLLVIGLLRAYVLWYGDILVTYGLLGMLVFLFRKKTASNLLIIGMVFFTIGSLPYLFIGVNLSGWPQQVTDMLMTNWLPSSESVTQEIAVYKGSWLQQMPVRAASAFFFQTNLLLMYVGWQVFGFMLIGMSLFKWDVLSAQLSRVFYIKLSSVGLSIGFVLTTIGMLKNFEADWSLEYAMFLGWQFNYWGSLFLSVGYIALTMLIFIKIQNTFISKALSAVGRTAFSNYILQTIICTLIFYGHGLGLFGDLERYWQITIVFVTWIFQSLATVLWLKKFRFGPLEWLWRSLTYRKIQSMKQS